MRDSTFDVHQIFENRAKNGAVENPENLGRVQAASTKLHCVNTGINLLDRRLACDMHLTMQNQSIDTLSQTRGADKLSTSTISGSALVDFASAGNGSLNSSLRYAFTSPRLILQARHMDEVVPLLHEVEKRSKHGMWCVGYVSYEAAPAFDAAFETHKAVGPLAWFGVYDCASPWPDLQEELASSKSIEWQAGVSRESFGKTLAEIKRTIAEGAFYQINFTAQMTGTPSQYLGPHDARDFFLALRRAQPGGYSAFLDTGTQHVMSVSPELFFDWRDGNILTRPMKGTAPRGATPEIDEANRHALLTSIKERAENVMIVDLLRNDLSRIAEPFSVKAPRLFQAQALPAVWQMTSDVVARTRDNCTLVDVFTGIFPCGSITGAPKIQAMKSIRLHENEARGIYCGAIGVVQPGGAATFNVPIRTVTMRSTEVGQKLQCGIGSGITSGSTANSEWAEWQHKQAFVKRASANFELLETFGMVDKQIANFDAHLMRLKNAAKHFGYAFTETLLLAALSPVIESHPTGSWRIRLLLNKHGRIKVEAFEFLPTASTVRLQLGDRPMEDGLEEFIRFKTTYRPHYDAFAPTQEGVFDTLIWNSRQEITECTRGNIALRLRDQWVTPALESGLLPGIGRAVALKEGHVIEARVTLADLPQVSEFFFINSLRGWLPAELIDASSPKISA